YELQEQVNGGSWTTIQNTSAISRNISKGNGSYGYRVRACNQEAGCSTYSATKTVQVAIVPAIPPNVSAPPASDNGTYTVSWNAVTHATSYVLEERVNNGVWVTIQNTAATSKAFSGKTNGT